MPKSIAARIRDLQGMTVLELRAEYLKVFGEETGSHHKQNLFRKVAWRIQQLAEGGLSERAKARASEIADEADVRTRPPHGFLDGRPSPARVVRPRTPFRDTRLPIAGTVLERRYKGRTIAVEVLKKGFRWDGQVYRSLSGIARDVTGTNWNGLAFFGLNGKGKR